MVQVARDAGAETYIHDEGAREQHVCAGFRLDLTQFRQAARSGGAQSCRRRATGDALSLACVRAAHSMHVPQTKRQHARMAHTTVARRTSTGRHSTTFSESSCASQAHSHSNPWLCSTWHPLTVGDRVQVGGWEAH